MSKYSPEKSPRILIVRLSAIGDVVMASGIVAAIRSIHPKAYIAWLVEPGAANLLSENPEIDDVIIWQRPQWRRLWRERQFGQLWSALRCSIRQLRARDFDIALDLQGLLKSGFWARASGAKQRFGLGSKEGSQHLMTQVIKRVADAPLISSEYIDMARHLGASAESFQMALPCAEATRSQVDTFLANAQLPAKPEKLLVCALYTTRPQKHWFDDYWLELFALAQGEGWSVVLLGGPDDKAKAEALIQNSGLALINACGETRLLEAAELIARAQLLIGVDTGLTHMGIAQKTPTLALFGSTRPYTQTPNSDAKVLFDALECAPCRRHPSCDGQFTCMRNLRPEFVWQQAKTLLPSPLSI